MYVTILKRFNTVDKQEKSYSSVQLFLEVYYHQRFTITRNITYENKIITFLKINESDQFKKKKKLVAYLVPQTIYPTTKAGKNFYSLYYLNF